MTVVERMQEWAKKYPTKKAYVFPSGSLSFYELDELSYTVAQNLFERGIKKGTKVAFFVRPGKEFFLLAFAFLRLGVIPIFIDPGMGRANIKRCLQSAKPDVFVGIPLAHMARLVFGWGRETINQIITVGPRLFRFGIAFEDLLKRSPVKQPFPLLSKKELAALVFTSGSTGTPKAVYYTHELFSAQLSLLEETYNLGPQEIELATFPLFAFFDPAFGMTAIIPKMDFTKPGRIHPPTLIEAIEKYGVTHMFGSPALLRRLAQYGETNRIQLSSVKRILSAGAPVPVQTLRKIKKLLPSESEIYTPYGATEALPISSISGREIINETSQQTSSGKGVCVGLPLNGVTVKIIKITDDPLSSLDEGMICQSKEIGEIIVHGTNVSKGYHENEQGNKVSKIETESGDLFHRMGDLGYFDDKGRLWVCGRKSHRVITKDREMYTLMCEGIFNQEKGVVRSALVGVGRGPNRKPVVCIERDKQSRIHWQILKWNLQRRAMKYGETKSIQHFLPHSSFPVDVRHNAKIFREKLAVWAEKKLS